MKLYFPSVRGSRKDYVDDPLITTGSWLQPAMIRSYTTGSWLKLAVTIDTLIIADLKRNRLYVILQLVCSKPAVKRAFD